MSGVGRPTFQELIDETRQLLYNGVSDEINLLATDLVPSLTSTFALTYPLGGAARRGSLLAIGQERMLVTNYDATANTVTVVRGYLTPSADTGLYTTTFPHTLGDLVLVNPRFDDVAIGRAINEELRSLSAPTNGLFQMLTTDLTWSPVQEGYDLSGLVVNNNYTAPFIDIYELTYKMYGPTKDWPRITRYELRRNLTTSGAGGDNVALMIYEPGWPNYPIHVLYKAGFGLMIDTTVSNTHTAGVPDTAVDIIPLGAAARLMAATEARRNSFQAQGDTRRAEEVPSGGAARAAATLMQMRNQRVDEERARLDLQYPIRRPR